MNRGEIWIAEVGEKRRPVLVLTRDAVLDVRSLVTVAEITTAARGLAAEIGLDMAMSGLDQESVVNCDGIHTVAQDILARRVGSVDERTMGKVCGAIAYALGC